MIVVSDDLRRMIVRGANAQDLAKEARRGGFRTMFEDGLAKVDAGITSIEEVMRVTRTVLDDDIYIAGTLQAVKKQFQ
jgi:general secretion pathway protein E